MSPLGIGTLAETGDVASADPTSVSEDMSHPDLEDRAVEESTDISAPRDGTPAIDSARIAEVARPQSQADFGGREVVFDARDLSVTYSGKLALSDVTLDVRKNTVMAFIGPSGCGKSTFIRCFNRMNDLIPGAVVEGSIAYHGQDLYGPKVDPVEVRRRIHISVVQNAKGGLEVPGGEFALGQSLGDGNPIGGTATKSIWSRF